VDLQKGKSKMLFINKEIEKQDLQQLIDNKVSENKELEYKDYTFENGKMTKLADKQKDKFVKEVAAFANTNGGTIIVGIQENEDRFPTKLSGAGFGIKFFDEWLSSFRQLILSRIRPHLHGVECIPVELNEDNIAIVISVPRSYARPHGFWDGNKDEFVMRYSNGIANMDIDDLRKEFLYANGLQDKIRQFRKDRISMILANECVGDLGNDAKLVVHIIPEWSFELGNNIDLECLETNSQFKPISGSIWDFRYNADGCCIYGIDHETNALKTYTQMFHNGIIEAVEIRLISQYRKKQVYNWLETQEEIFKAINQYKKLLEENSIPKPWHISASLLNAKGYVTYNGWESSFPIERNIVNSLDGIYTEDTSLEEAVKPVFNSLSNAFGYRKSGIY